MASDNQVKKDFIIEAAIKRFTHFGIAKTSITEIAEDISLTKQALAYYFPDKQSIIQAAEEKITAGYIEILGQQLNKAASFKKALDELINVKYSYCRKYYILAHEVEQMEQTAIKPTPHWKEALKAREIALLAPLVRQGTARGELKPSEPAKTSELLLATMYAFTQCVNMKGGVADEQALLNVFEKIGEVITLFYDGLKTDSWKN